MPKNKVSIGVLIAGALVLVCSMAFIFFQDRFRPKQTFHASVADLLPKLDKLQDWKVSYLPIAETPEMQKRVLDILDYDDAVYAIYTKGNLRISLYLAYWKPGKVTPRSVARHTPDVCWTLAGWECTKRNEIDRLIVDGMEIRQSEYREFTINKQTEHVLFWHIVGEEVVSYHTGWRPPWYATVTDFFRWGNQQKQEQFFLRISSNCPLSVLSSSQPTIWMVNQFRQISKKL